MSLFNDLLGKKEENIFDDKDFAIGYKKQITIPLLNKRIIALMIDLLIPCIIYYLFVQFLNKINIIQLFDQKELMIKNLESLKKSGELGLKNQYMPDLKTSFIAALVNYLGMGVYIVYFWNKFSASPGKIIMRIKIVNYKDISKPSLKSFIIRYLGYPICIFNVFSFIFNKKKRLLHDVISGTIVIGS